MKTAAMEVTLIDHMGSDLSVVNAARVSFHKESNWEFGNADGEIIEVLPDADARLIRYLSKHNHWSPFAHAFVSFRIKAPIFVARQLVKHQVGLAWNEVSRRYVDEEPEFWFPETVRSRPEGSVKQGSGGEHYCTSGWIESFKMTCEVARIVYEDAIMEGVAPEQARMILPQNMMTEWIWSGSLAAFARVCKLRLDPHAQQETREVAEKIDTVMADLFPVSWKELMK